MVKLIGWLSIGCTFLMLLFSGFMYLLEAPPSTCLLMAMSSLLPAVIAIACLSPRMRTPAVRIIGVVLLIVGIAVIVVPFVVNDPDQKLYRRLSSKMLLVAVGGYLAVKGRWIGDSIGDNEKSEKSSTEGSLTHVGSNSQNESLG